jgi:hypothetical protein
MRRQIISDTLIYFLAILFAIQQGRWIVRCLAAIRGNNRSIPRKELQGGIGAAAILTLDVDGANGKVHVVFVRCHLPNEV